MRRVRLSRNSPLSTQESRIPTDSQASSRLRRNLISTLIGTVSYLGASYLQLTVLGKWRGTETVGDFAIANAWVIAVLGIAQMQLRQLRVTDAAGQHLLVDYLALRTWTSGAGILAMLGLGIIFQFDAELWTLTGFLAIQKTFESFSEISYGELQRADRMEWIAGSQLLRGIFSISLFAWIIHSGMSLAVACAALMVVSVLIFCLFDTQVARQFAHDEQPVVSSFGSRQTALFWSAAPFAMVAGIQAACGQSSRFLMESFHGASGLAYFVVASAPLSMVTLLTGALHQSTLSRATRLWQASDWQQYHRLCAKLTILFLSATGVGTIVFACYGADILEVLFTAEYRQSAPALLIMVSALNLTALATGFSLNIVVSRSSWLQLGTTVSGLTALVISGVLFIPSYGAIGAAWSEFCRFAAIASYQLVVGAWVYWRRRRTEPNVIVNFDSLKSMGKAA